MIFLDTETTGLLKPDAAALNLQPSIIEISIIKTDGEYKIIEELNEFVNPRLPIPEFITGITNITDAMVSGQPTFPELYPRIVDIFLGERVAVAHNVTFDMGMLWLELRRMDKEFNFPWAPDWCCTIEASMPLEHRRIKLGDLYERVTGRPHVSAHRARGDVIALIECHKWLAKRGMV